MKRNNSIKKMTGLSILTSIIIVLQIICTFIKFGPFSITLALTPIIIGGAIYGFSAAAFLGAVLGAVVFVTGILGWDGGFVNTLMSQNAFATIFACFFKTIAAGFLSTAMYRLFCKRNEFVSVVLAGIVCPVINTGIFLAVMAIFFGAASGSSIVNYFISTFVGANFIVELVTTLVLSSAIYRIIKLGKNLK